MIRRLRTYFIAGILVITPTALTIFIFWKIFKGLDNTLIDGINNLLMLIGLQPYHVRIPGIGIIGMVILIILTGMVARNYFGNKLFKLGEWVLSKIPFLSKIYIALQQILEAIFAEKREVFKKAVMFEYPRKGTYSIGFVTQDTRGEIQDRIPDDVLSVFLPTTPNPTSGYLIFVPKKDAILLDMTVEEALKLIISGGSILPSFPDKKEIGLEDLFPSRKKKSKKKLSKTSMRAGDEKQ